MPENSEELKRKSDEEFLRHLPSMSEVSRAIRTGDDPSPEEALGRI